MYANFKKDPFFLQRYNIWCTLLLLAAILLCGASQELLRNPYIFVWAPVALLFGHSSFRSVVIGLVLSVVLFFTCAPSVELLSISAFLAAGIYVGIWSNVLIHNAAHQMIQPAWLNRAVGELAGIQVLSGFPGFAVLHIEHHRHSDDADLDPHPNLPGQGFWQYLDGTRLRLRSTFRRMYQERWGHNPKHLQSWKKVRWLLPLNRVLRALLLLVVLGPEGFTFFFIPSHIATQIAFAVINFYSHLRLADGSVEIRNLDHHWVYRLINRGFAGAFYHRNHHLSPHLFNPMRLDKKNA